LVCLPQVLEWLRHGGRREDEDAKLAEVSRGRAG
jgi:hypothetical protein